MAVTGTSDLASSRWAVLRTIERLDPEQDHQRIVHLSFGYEFPWDSIRALEIALYRNLLRAEHLGAAGPHWRIPPRQSTLVDAERRRHERRPGSEGGSAA
jgi:hypothetical protein